MHYTVYVSKVTSFSLFYRQSSDQYSRTHNKNHFSCLVLANTSEICFYTYRYILFRSTLLSLDFVHHLIHKPDTVKPA